MSLDHAIEMRRRELAVSPDDPGAILAHVAGQRRLHEQRRTLSGPAAILEWRLQNGVFSIGRVRLAARLGHPWALEVLPTVRPQRHIRHPTINTAIGHMNTAERRAFMADILERRGTPGIENGDVFEAVTSTLRNWPLGPGSDERIHAIRVQIQEAWGFYPRSKELVDTVHEEIPFCLALDAITRGDSGAACRVVASADREYAHPCIGSPAWDRARLTIQRWQARRAAQYLVAERTIRGDIPS